MGTKAFLTKGWPTRLGFYLGKYLLPQAGRSVASIAARLIVTLKPDMYWAVRSNLRHVLGGDVPEAVLRRRVHRLFINAARGYYELFHNVGGGVLDVRDFHPPVCLTPEAKAHIWQGLDSGRGVFFLGAHLSNFDLAWIGVSQYIPEPMQALSLAHPPPGFEFFNCLRARGNVILTPISPQALLEAIHRLRQGGLVITGVDRPIGEGDEPVEFFGATAYLPTGYLRIPLRTDCLVMTLGAYYEREAYWVIANPPMEMVRTGDPEQDMAVNLRRVHAQVEGMIRRYPEQWMMFIPVWDRERL